MFDHMIHVHATERHEEARHPTTRRRVSGQPRVRTAVARRLVTVAGRLDPDLAPVTALPRRRADATSPASRRAA